MKKDIYIMDGGKNYVHKIISKLISRSPKRRELSLKERIRTAEKQNDPALVMKLLEELHKTTVSSRKRLDDVLRQ